MEFSNMHLVHKFSDDLTATVVAASEAEGSTVAAAGAAAAAVAAISGLLKTSFKLLNSERSSICDGENLGFVDLPFDAITKQSVKCIDNFIFNIIKIHFLLIFLKSINIIKIK
jgi:hypothetical protein